MVERERREGAVSSEESSDTDSRFHSGSLTDEVRPQDAWIIPMELQREASESYLAYALSVIVGRALPDCRDGLKPVHRRIM